MLVRAINEAAMRAVVGRPARGSRYGALLLVTSETGRVWEMRLWLNPSTSRAAK
jgi:hypothetical protein